MSERPVSGSDFLTWPSVSTSYNLPRRPSACQTPQPLTDGARRICRPKFPPIPIRSVICPRQFALTRSRRFIARPALAKGIISLPIATRRAR